MIVRVRVTHLWINRQIEGWATFLPHEVVSSGSRTRGSPSWEFCLRHSGSSPSIFAYCKRSKTGAGEGLGTRLAM